MPNQRIQKHPTIGVLAGWQYAWTATPFSYLDPIFQGICLAARDMGCNVLLGCGMGLWTGQRESLRTAWPVVSPESDFVPIGPWNTDALIVINPLHSEVRSRYLQELRAAGHPVISIASGEPGPVVVADNEGGVFAALEHLVAHGHSSIAFIAGSQDDIEGDSGERLRAYHHGVKLHDLFADPRLIGWGHHLYDGGYVAMREILNSGVSFTAVLASNDESALGAMRALHEAGLRVPQDIALIGFDDRPESAVQEPALSSVRIPLRKMGYRAVRALWRFLTGQSSDIESDRVPVRLIVRQSCGCVPHASRHLSTDMLNPPYSHEALVQSMTAAILPDAQGLPATETRMLCDRLVTTFVASVEQDDPTEFQTALEVASRQGIASGDDAHLWQTALTYLDMAIPLLSEVWSRPTAREVAQSFVDQARITISAGMRSQYLQQSVDQHWLLYRLSALTARLLATRDEAQVYETLRQDLSLLGVSLMWVGLMEEENNDPVAWTKLYTIIPSGESDPQPSQHLCIRSREFHPEALFSKKGTFSLALFPLTGPQGQLGFVVFDTAQLDLYGALVPLLATALNSAQLYREATEGRRLAEQANELKSRFLSTVSHELRTPLNLIVGLSEVVLQEGEESEVLLSEPYRKDIENIHLNAQYLGGLIGDVLDLASSDAGQLRLKNDYVDLGAALRMVAETGRQLAMAKGLEWRATFPVTREWVWGDQTRLRQIGLNLINNAIKFTAKGHVHLEVTSSADSVTVAVHDTGLGIPPEEQEGIFDEFRRAERSVLRGYSGLGLGLAICKHLVELHGGRIAVHSSGKEGAGSTFSFTLPKVTPPWALAETHVALPLTAESVVVLTYGAGSGARLVEHLLERGLDGRMFLIDETSDWLMQLTQTPPGAIVIDVSSTPEQGWYVLRLLKDHRQTQSLPVLFYSLSQDSGSVLQVDYLTKPIEVTDLTRALDQHWLAPDTPAAAKTILVVDDEPTTLEMHARIAQAHAVSHRVLRAQNGLQALEILQRETVDLVLLDLVMPEMDGFEVLDAMRAREATRDIPVIVLTGQVLTEREMAHLNQGVATVLSKGVFNLEETLAHVDAALEHHRKVSDEARRLVRQAMAYIHEHYAEPISRSSLAQYIAYSEDYLTFCFRKELGVTPITYLNRYRVNQAKRLLKETQKSITEIGLDVGFSDSSYFSRVFRREVGLSPEAFRSPKRFSQN